MKCRKLFAIGKITISRSSSSKADVLHISPIRMPSLRVIYSRMTQFDQRKTLKMLIDGGTT